MGEPTYIGWGTGSAYEGAPPKRGFTFTPVSELLSPLIDTTELMDKMRKLAAATNNETAQAIMEHKLNRETPRSMLLSMGYAMSEDLHSAERFLRHQLDVLPVEFAVLIAPGGGVTGILVGNKQYVDVPEAQMRHVRGGIITHSHPEVSTLSLHDITTAACAFVHEIRAVLPNDEIHSFRLPDFNRSGVEAQRWVDRVVKFIESGNLTIPRNASTFMAWVCLWEDVARELGGSFSMMYRLPAIEKGRAYDGEIFQPGRYDGPTVLHEHVHPVW